MVEPPNRLTLLFCLRRPQDPLDLSPAVALSWRANQGGPAHPLSESPS